MKILIVDVFGAVNSTGKITTLQYRYMKSRGHEVRVCYRGVREPKIDNPDYQPVAGAIEPGVGRLLSWITGYEGFCHPLATKRLIQYTQSFHPDIVQLNILHGYFINSHQYIRFLNDHHYRVCYTMMDEYAYMGKCPYSFSCNQFLTGCTGGCPEQKHYPKSFFFDRSAVIWQAKERAYRGFEHIVFTGPGWVVDRARRSQLLRGFDIRELDEPVDFGTTFHPRDVKALRTRLNIPESHKVIVTVAQMSNPRKGGIYFLQAAELLAHQEDLTFVFVGYDVKQPVTLPHVVTVPYVSSQEELAQYYALGDLFVCTSLADTMPNVCIEALGCGTPLAGFAEAGTPYVAPSAYATFTKTYDIPALAQVIASTPKKSPERSAACHQYAVGRYAGEVIFAKLEKIYQSLIQQ